MLFGNLCLDVDIVETIYFCKPMDRAFKENVG